jgi:drug/metabolite transporter (DMT)-like permease
MWVALALAASLAQSARNAFARSLSGRISPVLNSWSRFAFNLPFSSTLFLTLVSLRGFPYVSRRYYALCLATGLAQLLGNVALIAAFRRASFAKSIVLHKLEIVFTAFIGAMFFSEYPTMLGWVGIFVCAAGVLLMHFERHIGTTPSFHFGAGALLAMTAGLLLVLASFWLKEANAELVHWNPRVGSGRFEVAAHTLFNVTWMEAVMLTLWLVRRRSGELNLVSVHWRRMALIGSTGFLGSLGWFWAYSLTLVAYVKAVGQLELVIAVVLSLVLWKEREVWRQLPGMAFVVAGILLVLFGGGT